MFRSSCAWLWLANERVKKIVIMGAGGSCLDVYEMLLALNDHASVERYRCLGLLDDNPALQGTEVQGLRVLGPLGQARSLEDCQFVFAIGSPGNFWKRGGILAGVGLPPERFETIVHPLASVSRFARLGAGCVVLAGSSIGANAVLGEHCILLQNVVVSHDCRVGGYSCLSPGACLAGGVQIGEHGYIGASATVRGGVHVGARSLVGMGSAVLENVPESTVVAGNPARYLRSIDC